MVKMNMCNHQARTVGEAHAAFRDINGSAGLPLAVKVAFGPIGSRLFPHDGCLALWCVTIDLTYFIVVGDLELPWIISRCPFRTSSVESRRHGFLFH